MCYTLSEDTGVMALFYVKSEYRNRGVGRIIWDKKIERLGEKNILMNAVERRAQKNIDLGFRDACMDTAYFIGLPKSLKSDRSKQYIDTILPMKDSNLTELLSYNSEIVQNMGGREKFYKTALKHYDVREYTAYKDNCVVGIIGDFKTENYFYIGPWYANSNEIARGLLNRYLSEVDHDVPICIFGPVNNQHALDIVSEIGISKGGGLQSRYII